MMSRVSGTEINKDWQAESDLDTLLMASKINKDPKRLEAVKKAAKGRKDELVAQIASVTNIEDGDTDD